MRFDVYGGFAISRKSSGLGLFDKSFWDGVRESSEKLPDACGCYVFALQNGSNIVPWYVGKTERRTFKKECFQATKINYYNDVLVNRQGRPILFLLPRLTRLGNRFSRPAKSQYRDVDFLEALVISMALERNKYLLNVQKTKLLKEMIVPGVINPPPGKPSRAVRDLRNALGL